MDNTMIELRLFVHQRLYTAAEEILGEVEKTITLALNDAEVSRCEGDAGGPTRRLTLNLQRRKSAADPPLTSSKEEHRDACGAPLLQENPGPSQTGADVDCDLNDYMVQTHFKMSEIKGGQEELWDNSQTQEIVSVKSEQNPPEAQVSYEMQPVSSDCSAARIENNDHDGLTKSRKEKNKPMKRKDSDEEMAKSKGEQNKIIKRKGNLLQGQSDSISEKDQMASLWKKCSAKSEMERSFCHFCGKEFQYISSFMKHIKTHENKFDCTVCGKTCPSTKQLVAHVKIHHNCSCVCNLCGKTFANNHCLRQHARIHMGIKEFACEECGKTFCQKGHLIVHLRTHSGEKPYRCDLCGKAFSQSQSLTIHKRTHSGEKPYECDLCDKKFVSRSHLQVHMRHHTRKKNPVISVVNVLATGQ